MKELSSFNKIYFPHFNHPLLLNIYEESEEYKLVKEQVNKSENLKKKYFFKLFN